MAGPSPESTCGAGVALEADENRLLWTVQSGSATRVGFDISASAHIGGAAEATSEVADIVVGTILGMSPKRNGRIETVEMRTAPSLVQAVELIDLDSEFISSFRSAQPADTLLMADTDVTWRAERGNALGSG